MTDLPPIRILALYKFTHFPNCAALRDPLLQACLAAGVRGTLVLAPEGINGTIAGTDEATAKVLAHIRMLPGCGTLEVKQARAAGLPFDRMKVRVKREIVTMGEPGIDPSVGAGRYVDARDWNVLIQQSGTILIDTRNDFEVAAGSFPGAINPHTTSFSDFPAWFRAQRQELFSGHEAPTVAMFCTGGIRCEKATAFLRAEGVGKVHHLQGGILKYLEAIVPEQSLWKGECFVFDQRVSVTHGLVPGN